MFSVVFDRRIIRVIKCKGASILVHQFMFQLPRIPLLGVAPQSPKMLKKAIRRIFVVLMLLTAIYYSNESIQSWNDNPVVTSGEQLEYLYEFFKRRVTLILSVKLKHIESIPSPAVSICHDIDAWKWASISSAMAKFDTNNHIGQQEYAMTFNIKQLGTSYKKSHDYRATKNMNDVEYFMKWLPDKFRDFAKFMYFIAYRRKEDGSSKAKIQATLNVFWLKYLRLRKLDFQIDWTRWRLFSR